MTLRDKYINLTESTFLFGKNHPALINGELTIEKLEQYAKKMQELGIPCVKYAAFEVNRNLAKAGYNLNNNI